MRGASTGLGAAALATVQLAVSLLGSVLDVELVHCCVYEGILLIMARDSNVGVIKNTYPNKTITFGLLA